MDNKDKLNNIFNKYRLTKIEQKEIYDIIKDIFLHKEFQKRLTDDFPHHGSTTLGEHILEDTIVTYILSKKKKYKDVNLEYALKIAMMHDLYTIPWQNRGIKKNSFFHKHGFAHPIEAVINSINWFEDEFKDETKSRILIDSIVHHMYPFPVMSYYDNKKNELELLNNNLINNISKMNKKILIESTNRNRIGKVSLTRCKYKEGKLMSKADKISSIKQIRNISDAIALLTGKNKSLIKNKD